MTLLQTVNLNVLQHTFYVHLSSSLLSAVGPISVHISPLPSLEEIKEKNPLVTLGGHYRPPDCKPRHHTAIVVPYRNRQTHLRALLYHLHPFLQRQQVHYGIYIVHQVSCLLMLTCHIYCVGKS